MAAMTFVFVANENENTYGRATKVTPSRLFNSEDGFGFVTEENRDKEEALQIPELNSGFLQKPLSDIKTKIYADDKGCFVKNGDIIPLIFKACVSRMGNYEISVKAFVKGDICVFSGCRNLVYKNFFEEETEVDISFWVKLISIIPNQKTCMYENRSVDVALLGKDVHLQKINIKESTCPTLFIAGDTYISNHLGLYPFSNDGLKAGWGQMLPVCVKKGMACYNYAKESLSVERFRQEGHFSLAQAHMKLGDYLLLHFAADEDETKLDSFIQGISNCIDEARAMGVYPVLVTPIASLKKMEKRSFDLIYRELSVKMNVPYVNLNKIGDKVSNFINSDEDLSDDEALIVARAFSSQINQQMGGQKPDPYTKFAKYFS